MNEELYALKQKFLIAWPIEKLEQMALEEYTNIDKTSFCYWLEHITRDLGSIVGGSSYKFGIYKRSGNSEVKEKSNRTTDGDYAWFKKYGENNKEEAFETIRGIIIKIANSAQSNKLESIDAIDLGNAYKWKIAFLYGDYNCLNVFKLDALRIIASNIGVEYNNKTPISQIHKEILSLKPAEKEYYSWSHELWKQYESRLIDVKKDFAKWLNKNTFESYRAYLGNTKRSIEDKLVEINSFFDDIDFFLVDPKKVNGLVSSILFLMSKKERVKNSDFVEYDSKNSNGIPKAILGKNNYIKYLKERFDYIAPNYWVFQGNPKIYDITNALKAGHVKSWKVAAHKDKIKIGDQIILWQTGTQAGCYALAEVTSEVNIFEEETFEQQYYINPSDNSATERVKIKIVKYLAEEPILWEELKDLDEFKEFKGSNQGTNFTATKDEYNTLLSMASINHTDFHDVINRYSKDEVLFYFEVLDEIVKKLNLKEGDNRLVFSTVRNHLNLTVGQRFAWRLTTKSNEKYCVISDKIINEFTTTFNGTPLHYYSTLTEKEDVSSNLDSVIRAIEIELKRSKKSSYKESNNKDFERAAFDKTFREKFIKTEIMKEDNTALNTILYGPPGTGKTFATKEMAVQISNPNFEIDTHWSSKEKREFIVKEYDRLCEEGLVVFSTFHQSMSYEDFVEGIKPITHKGEISYQVESGIFKNAVKNALSEYIDSNEKGEEDFDVLYQKFIDKIKHHVGKNEAVFFTKTGVELILEGVSDSSILVKYLWSNSKQEQPGQRTFIITKEKLKKVLIEGVEPDNVKSLKAEIIPIVGHIHSELFAVYKAFYEFLIANKGDVDTVQYNTIDLSFDDVLEQVSNYSKAEINSKQVKNYTLIIDEINRGNVSAIFGELITLLEDDKRIGKNEELRIKLPYSKINNFGVPQNLYIIGTMNTADRSVEALDTALRRRFEFKEIMPDYTVIKDQKVADLQLSEVLQIINERIELLVDRDHTIGHSYFINVNSKKALANAFNNKIVPLLQEYFYGDYGKIGLVIGEGFVKKSETKNIAFATFKYEDSDDFKTPKYNLIKVNKRNIIPAIKTLLGKVEKPSED